MNVMPVAVSNVAEVDALNATILAVPDVEMTVLTDAPVQNEPVLNANVTAAVRKYVDTASIKAPATLATDDKTLAFTQDERSLIKAKIAASAGTSRAASTQAVDKNGLLAELAPGKSAVSLARSSAGVSVSYSRRD